MLITKMELSKARAIENSCNVLCTMAYLKKEQEINPIFGYDSNGKKLEYSILGSRGYKR